MRLIFFIGIYVLKYQIMVHFRGWMGAYLIILCLEWALIRGVRLIEALRYLTPLQRRVKTNDWSIQMNRFWYTFEMVGEIEIFSYLRFIQARNRRSEGP